MKISEMIKKLQAIMEKHGDLEVEWFGEERMRAIKFHQNSKSVKYVSLE